MSSKVSLVIGRFYPPHLGHHFLINVASQNTTDQVLVLALGRSDEKIPLVDRVRWLKQAHAHQFNVRIIPCYDEVETNYDDDKVWKQHIRVWENALHNFDAPDTLFSSEEYGDELAARLEIHHVLVDLDRTMVPISATKVKKDPLLNARYLDGYTRAGLTKRIVVVGAESTGTSTLAQDLSFAAEAPLVPEYGHVHALQKMIYAQGIAQWFGDYPLPSMEELGWTDQEFVTIAREQNRMEELTAQNARGLLLICDTDAWTTQIWQERYTGRSTPLVQAEARRDAALYIVTSPNGVPFVQDGTRDGEELRYEMTQTFINRLNQRTVPYIIAEGTRNQRIDQALDAIHSVYKWEW